MNIEYINFEWYILWLKIHILFLKNVKKLKKLGIDNKIWKKKFLHLWKTQDKRCKELLDEFMTCQMEKITSHKIKRKNKYSPILFCVIKNDISKIKKFMTHYRNIGVETFIFLDNNSDDGTKEFLYEQKDVILYQSKQQYSSVRRVAWLNRLLAIYGKNRWCLIVDSDELIEWIGSEEYKIDEIVKKAIEKKCYRIEGFMLDMYSDKNILQENNEIRNCRYFDKNSYKLCTAKTGLVITGGPRKRLFQLEEIKLSKYPLFFFRDEDFIASSHYMTPFLPIKQCPVWFAICHYKFIDDKDLVKIKEAVRDENYAGNSFDYKKYLSMIERNHEISFYEENNSLEMKDSNALKNISFLKSPFY